MRPLAIAQHLWVSQHGIVVAHPHLDKRLPGRANAELGHARPGRLLQIESPDQGLGHFLARETDHILEGGHRLGLRQGVGAEFDGGAGVGQRLETLRLNERAIQIENHGLDHRITSPSVSVATNTKRTPSPRSSTFCGI